MKQGRKQLIYLFLGFAFVSFSQNKITDSLAFLLKAAKYDTTRCNLLNLMIESENDDAVWPKYNKQILEIADKNLKNPGALKNHYLKYRAMALNNEGYLANIYGESKKATQYMEEALAIQQQIGHKKGIAASLYNLGDTYSLQGDLSKGLEYLHRSLDLHEELKDEMGTAYVLNDIGWQYHIQGDDGNAIIYSEKAGVIRKKINDKHGLAYTYGNLGIIFLNKNDHRKAMEFFKMSLSLMKEVEDEKGVANTLNSIGSIYHAEADLKTALDYYKKAAELQLKTNDKSSWITSNTNTAKVLLEMANGNIQKYPEIIKMCNKSMEGARTMGFPTEIGSAAQTLQRIYLRKGDYKKAFEYFELYTKMRDSVSNEETRRISVKKQFQYQYEKKAAADSVKNTEEQKVKDAQLNAQQSELKQEKTQRYALYGGLALIVAFLIFVVNRFRITQKQKAIIEKQKIRVDLAYEKLHEKNKEVMDSIMYARRIQRALLPNEKYISKHLSPGKK